MIEDGWHLQIVGSSMGFNYEMRLVNTVGSFGRRLLPLITEGHINKNRRATYIKLKHGDKFVTGIFVPCYGMQLMMTLRQSERAELAAQRR